MARFGVEPAALGLGEGEFVERHTPGGNLSSELAAKTKEALAALAALEARALKLDPNLSKPVQKTQDLVGGALKKLGGKFQAAEAAARGFGPKKLKRLWSWVRPGGQPQERIFSAPTMRLVGGAGCTKEILENLDVFDHRHRLVFVDHRKEKS
jgi:hypothetical protein